MDSGLKAFNITEPWSDPDDGNDICHYLWERRIHFTMRATSLLRSPDNISGVFMIYTTEIPEEEATLIKLKFPDVIVKPCSEPEKVSTVARRVI